VSKVKPFVRRCIQLLVLCTLVVSTTACIKDQDRISGDEQMRTERPLAGQRLSAYLLDKYGLDESDYSVIRNEPYMNGDAGITIEIGGGSLDGVNSYFSGFWQARIQIAGNDEYINYSVSEPYFGYDTLQADEYYAALESWLYDNLLLPEGYSVGLEIDNSNNKSLIDSPKTIYPAKNPLESLIALCTGDYGERRSLRGYYDESDIFSAVTQKLMVTVRYSNDLDDGRWDSNAIDYEGLFRQAIAKDITIFIQYRKSPSTQDPQLLWSRIGSSDKTDYPLPSLESN
jgi:hypothetical protein